jgi:outer membrane protein assembly factor BamB
MLAMMIQRNSCHPRSSVAPAESPGGSYPGARAITAELPAFPPRLRTVSIRWNRAAAAAVFAAVTALAGCSMARPPVPVARPAVSVLRVTVTTPALVARTRLRVVTGRRVRALWQGAPWARLTFDGGTLLGTDGARVDAVSAATGEPLWTATLPSTLPQVVGLVPAAGAVIVEAGNAAGQAPGAVFPAVSEYIALDLATGRMLWAAPAGGQFQNPPIAVSGKYLLTADPSGDVTARVVATGAVAWQHQRPAACRQPPDPGADTAGLGLAADGPLAAASFDCGPRVIVQRLDPATGRARWTWKSPAVAAGATQQLALTAAANDGGILLLTGEIAAPPAAQQFASLLPHARAWPQDLDPPDQISILLALSAIKGRPLWTELGGQLATFALSAGAICEMVSGGLECRADATGASTLPILLTGKTDADSPPYAGDGFAGVSDGLAAVTLPARRGVTLRVVRIRGGAIVAQVHLAVGATAAGGADYQVFAVGAGPLRSGAIEVLVRRVDMPGYPVLALAVRLRQLTHTSAQAPRPAEGRPARAWRRRPAPCCTPSRSRAGRNSARARR